MTLIISLIKDKIHEYILNEGQQQQQTGSTATVSKNDVTYVSQIRDSLDQLLQKRKNTAKNKKTSKNRPATVSAPGNMALIKSLIKDNICKYMKNEIQQQQQFLPPLPPKKAKR